MFRCHFCQQVTPPGTKKTNIVIGTREKTYPARRKEVKRGRFGANRDAPQDAGGSGIETIKEVAACPSCAAKQETLAANAPETSAASS